jgi:hypothetical protein
MATRAEVAELVINLSENMDEAEQFIDYVPDIIRHCEKKFLISLLENMKESVEFNIRNGQYHLLMHSEEEIAEMFKQVDKIVGSDA